MRSPQVKALACICCAMDDVSQVTPTEEHHLNKFGLMGKQRRGNEYSIPLCAWHHRGIVAEGKNSGWMLYKFGPSFALNKRLFRTTYGTDDELLAKTDQFLEATVSLK